MRSHLVSCSINSGKEDHVSCSNSSGEAHSDVGQRCIPVTTSFQVDKLNRTKQVNKENSA